MSETITTISEAVKIVETFIQDMADDKLDTGDKEKLAEADFRLSEGANSRIQIEAVVASFAILGRNLNKA